MVTKKYMNLIERLPLVPIKSEHHLDRAHAVAQSLFALGAAIAPDESDYLEVLLDQIGKYEDKHHAIKLEGMAPHELLQSFMEDHKLNQLALETILSVSSDVMSELVAGKKELTKEHCVKLGNYFKVSPALFLPKIFA